MSLKYCPHCKECSVKPKKYFRQDGAYCYVEHCLNAGCGRIIIHRILELPDDITEKEKEKIKARVERQIYFNFQPS